MTDLWDSIKITKKLEIKNRFVVSPMHSGFGSEKHIVTDEAVSYYKHRAIGGFGLIITEFMCVDLQGMSNPIQIGIYDDKFIVSLKKLSDELHKNGAKCFAQLQHGGIEAKKEITGMDVVGPGAIMSLSSKQQISALKVEEIKRIIENFSQAAFRAKIAGFDGVELHAGHGYLLNQFLSKAINKRCDMYGGDIAGRARIVCEIIEKIKEKCGNDYPVSVRISADEYMPYGNNVHDAVNYCRIFENAGADIINVSSGSLFVGNSSGIVRANHIEPGYNMQNAKMIKEAVNIPVMVVGRINDASLARSIINTGCADMVVLGRQSIADSEFPNKVKEKREEEIFHCIGCLQRCNRSGVEESDIGVSCMINPFSGKEERWVINNAIEKKKIAIVGAGPAGMQAGWILAKRGHEVTVYEKNNQLGGQFLLASVPPFKQDMGSVISTYEYLLKKYRGKVVLNKEVTPENINALNADVLVLATGSVPLIPRIDGIDPETVITAQSILSGEKTILNSKVLIIGAGLVGCETAEFLCAYGNKVDIVEMGNTFAPTMESKSSRMHLEEFLGIHGTKMYLNTKVTKVLSDGIEFETVGGEKGSLTGYDRIVLALGARSYNPLFEEVKDKFNEVYVIGDAFKAGDAKKCIYEATKLALEI